MTLVSALTIDPVLFGDELPFVMGCLRQVLEESGEPELARALPWYADDAPTPEMLDVPTAGLAQAQYFTNKPILRRPCPLSRKGRGEIPQQDASGSPAPFMGAGARGRGMRRIPPCTEDDYE